MQRILFFKSSTKTVETDCFIMTKKKLSHFLKKKKDYDPLEVVRKEKNLKSHIAERTPCTPCLGLIPVRTLAHQ